MADTTTPPRQRATGRAASGTTPISIKASSLLFISQKGITEALGPAIKTEMQDNIRVVNTQEFLNAFLPPLPSPSDGTPNIAKDCLEYLETRHVYENASFAGILKPGTEKQMYSAVTVLMNEIPDWYSQRSDFKTSLLVPNPEDPSKLAKLRLAGEPYPEPQYSGRRHRFVYGREKIVDGHSSTKCDIYMVLAEEGKVKKEELDGRETWVSKLKKLTWPDVRIPIEVKKDLDPLGSAGVFQMTNYFRNLKHAQPDRVFYFTMSINSTQCRLWRWDASACYVTEAIRYHEDPVLFVDLIARLACMTPAQLGYDPHFLNAGLLLEEDRVAWKPHLQMHPSSFPLTPPPTPPPEPTLAHMGCSHNDDGPEIYRVEETVCRPHGIFGRNTFIWRATKIGGPNDGAKVAIKQAWQDAERENEADFFNRAKDIGSGVAKMHAFEPTHYTFHLHCEVNGTVHRRRRQKPGGSGGIRSSGQRSQTTRSSAGARQSNQSSRGSTSRTPSRTSQLPPSNGSATQNVIVHRVLQRMVFNEFGKPLTLDNGLDVFLGGMVDALEGYAKLLQQGILHRDISTGNIMLSSEESAANHWGFLIDLGLSQSVTFDPNTGQTTAKDGSTPHVDRTGTLPFMAWQLLNPQPDDPKIQHLPRHDLESFFWVLLWIISPAIANRLSEEQEDKLQDIKYGILGRNIDLRRTPGEVISDQVNNLRKLLLDHAATVFILISAFKEMYQVAKANVTIREPAPKRQSVDG